MIESRDYVAAFSGELPSNPRALRARADVLVARAAQSPDDLDALMLARDAVGVASHTAKGRRGGDERGGSGLLRRIDAIACKDPATNIVYSAVAKLQRAVVEVHGTGPLPDRIVGSIRTPDYPDNVWEEGSEGFLLGIIAGSRLHESNKGLPEWTQYELLSADYGSEVIRPFNTLPTLGGYSDYDRGQSLTRQLPQLDTVGVRCLPDEQRQLFAEMATRLLDAQAVVRV